jgi:hypothetical protein
LGSNIIEQNAATMLSGMTTRDALSFYSDTDNTYRVTWACGSAEAAERQRRAGEGDVTSGGYTRTVSHELFADMARSDPDATVEVLGDE